MSYSRDEVLESIAEDIGVGFRHRGQFFTRDGEPDGFSFPRRGNSDVGGSGRKMLGEDRGAASFVADMRRAGTAADAIALEIRRRFPGVTMLAVYRLVGDEASVEVKRTAMSTLERVSGRRVGRRWPRRARNAQAAR